MDLVHLNTNLLEGLQASPIPRTPWVRMTVAPKKLKLSLMRSHMLQLNKLRSLEGREQAATSPPTAQLASGEPLTAHSSPCAGRAGPTVCCMLA